ncbi:putative RNA-directed DNA polymerase [Senna tora]|uniref:Putative RNA-directed DNA polymerase n=1 Tax=Senna tora TaxID=362788 RepID=A0A834WT81_9FABA|nr:putative RNA-directed DNA polymerase [Senna tora]
MVLLTWSLVTGHPRSLSSFPLSLFRDFSMGPPKILAIDKLDWRTVGAYSFRLDYLQLKVRRRRDFLVKDDEACLSSSLAIARDELGDQNMSNSMEGERQTGRRGRCGDVEITFNDEDVNKELVSAEKYLVGRVLTSKKVNRTTLCGTDMTEGRGGVNEIEEMCAEKVMENVGIGGKEGSMTSETSVGRKEGSNIAGSQEMQVLQEIHNITYEGVVSTNASMKENINPTMKPSGGKQWKRLARGGALITNANVVESKGGKQKSMEEEPNALIDIDARRTVLASGMRRSIGDGKSTRVWKDPWVIFDRPTTLTVSNQNAAGVEKVCDLMNESGNSWDEEKLRRCFDVGTCQRIMCVPPNRAQGGDRWVWEVERSGSYTMKSGYRHAMIDTWRQFEMGLDIDVDATSKF